VFIKKNITNSIVGCEVVGVGSVAKDIGSGLTDGSTAGGGRVEGASNVSRKTLVTRSHCLFHFLHRCQILQKLFRSMAGCEGSYVIIIGNIRLCLACMVRVSIIGASGLPAVLKSYLGIMEIEVSTSTIGDEFSAILLLLWKRRWKSDKSKADNRDPAACSLFKEIDYCKKSATALSE